MPKLMNPKRLTIPLLLALCAAPAVFGAEKAGRASRFSTPLHAVSAANDREQDGLAGPVRRVKTETAKISVKNGKPVEGPRAVLETITYDNKGTRVDSAYFLTAGGSLTGKEVYKYDDRGNMVEMTLHEPDGSLLAKETYSYEFDAVGNWVKMTTAVAVIEGGKLTFEPTEVTYRTIAYYLEEAMVARLSQPPAPAAAPAQAAATPQPTAPRPAAQQPPPAQPASSQPASMQAASSQQAALTGGTQHASFKSVNKPAEVAPNKPAEKPVEKAAERPAEKSVERAAERPAEKPADKAEKVAGGATVPTQVAALSPDRGAAGARQPAPAAANAGQPAAANTSQPNPPAEPAAKPAEVAAKPAETPKPEGEAPAKPVVRGPLKPVSGGILNGKALTLPPPQYPDIARRAAVAGIVEVEVVIDVTGKVISAKALKGPAMLQQAAEYAARQAKFVPTLLSGQPVKVSGVITYNFALR